MTRSTCEACLTIALSVAVNVAAMAAHPVDGLFRRGDVDQTGVIDISDGVAVFNFLFLGSGTLRCIDAADSNDDGALDITDGVYVLNFLFLGGPPPPPPSFDGPCPGVDPTPDELGCDEGETPVGGDSLPSVDLAIVRAPPPAVRQRVRERVPTNEAGEYVIAEGVDFALLIEARSHEVTRAGFELAHGMPRTGDSATLDVRCDRDLGDPLTGGIAAGENLAPLFFVDVDGWEDRIYLIEHAAARIDGGGPRGPAPSVYRFTARVTDVECAVSDAAEIVLRVEPSSEPRVRMWIEDATSGELLQHDAGSGHVHVPVEGTVRLVVEAVPNGHGGSGVDLDSLRVAADPPLAGGADLSAAFTPLADHPDRRGLLLAAPWTPAVGNTRIEATVDSIDGGPTGGATFTLAVPVSYADEIQPIWTRSCTGCHEAPSPNRGLELVHPDSERTRRNIVNVFARGPELESIAPRLVRPYLLDRSYLWRKLTGPHLDEGVLGDGWQMPLGGELDAEDLRLVESWIVEGARS